VSCIDYSIIVPAYQAAGVIGICVRALNHQTVLRERYEIIVVNDSSTDETAEIAREAGADRVLTCAHGGPAAARNAGIEAARGRIVLFTDADCEPSPEWLERMTAPFADPQVMGVKGAYQTQQRGLIARLVQLEFEIRYERMARLPQIDFIDGYAAAYRRALLDEYGGFDVAYPIPSAEDVDLSFRLAKAGHRLVFVPEAWVWHRHPVSLRDYLVRKGQYGLWRALLYLRYPEKRSGDAHTDPALKKQFVLVALIGLLGVTGLIWWPLAVAGAGLLFLFLVTTLPFVRWAWPRDREVATVWPLVTLLRVAVQGVCLTLGLIYHGLVTRRERTISAPEGTTPDV
jgi:cellulose synthase/poly-beta-1,6-N-acetylglucosamine synthase-like glycosyltransferase